MRVKGVGWLLIGMAPLVGAQGFCPDHPEAPQLVDANGLASSGTAACSRVPNGSGGFTTTIDVFSDSIISWESLDSEANDELVFNHVNGGGSVLNVGRGGTSFARGSVMSDGRLGMVNPGGNLNVFGAIEAEEVYLATQSLDSANQASWLAGQPVIFGDEGVSAGALVRFRGAITANSGDVVLTGSEVRVTGGSGSPVTALEGAVVMAAGNEVVVEPSVGQRVTSVKSVGRSSSISNNTDVFGESISLKAVDDLEAGTSAELNTTIPNGKIFLEVNDSFDEIRYNTNLLNGVVCLNGVLEEVILFDPSDPRNPNSRSATLSRFPSLEKKEKRQRVVVDHVPSLSTPRVQEEGKRKPVEQAREGQSRKSLYRGVGFFGIRGAVRGGSESR
ncbi:MAG: hypothetical protein AAGC74_10310 [Verrucomicrobiota bacterium]